MMIIDLLGRGFLNLYITISDRQTVIMTLPGTKDS